MSSVYKVCVRARECVERVCRCERVIVCVCVCVCKYAHALYDVSKQPPDA